jgi:hypothetical protein
MRFWNSLCFIGNSPTEIDVRERLMSRRSARSMIA